MGVYQFACVRSSGSVMTPAVTASVPSIQR
jgi:hypothetical protein